MKRSFGKDYLLQNNAQKRENTDPASKAANRLFSLFVIFLLHAANMILLR